MPIAKLYRSEKEVAALLGHRIDWLRANATKLEKQYGLPPIDPAVGMRHIPSIEEWARERNTRMAPRSSGRLTETNHTENKDAF